MRSFAVIARRCLPRLSLWILRCGRRLRNQRSCRHRRDWKLHCYKNFGGGHRRRLWPGRAGYMPLPYAYDQSELEGGAVVRVVLPRAALVSYGLPMKGMGVADNVTADMVVSQDGTPQAIRLVAHTNANSDTDADF